MSGDVTLVLKAIEQGDKDAAERLLPLVYDELRKLAEARMAEIPPGQTLQATALVHEAYLRVVGDTDPGWNSRGHFFGAAARAMRNILVDQARRKGAARHGGGLHRVEGAELALATPDADYSLVELDEVLKRLEQLDHRKAMVVMLRFFAGLTIDEVALALSVAPATVERDWAYAKAWLFRELSRAREDGEAPTIG